MKLSYNDILNGKWIHDATLEWEQYSLPSGSNRAIALDAYGVFALEAPEEDTYVKEVASATAAATEDLDGYGLLVRSNGSPTVIVGQWGYGGTMHLAARPAEAAVTILRIKKIGRIAP